MSSPCWHWTHTTSLRLPGLLVATTLQGLRRCTVQFLHTAPPWCRRAAAPAGCHRTLQGAALRAFLPHAASLKLYPPPSSHPVRASNCVCASSSTACLSSVRPISFSPVRGMQPLTPEAFSIPVPASYAVRMELYTQSHAVIPCTNRTHRHTAPTTLLPAYCP